MLVAETLEVLHRVLALKVVAQASSSQLGDSADEIREALLDERWGDAVVAYIHWSGLQIDVYDDLRVFRDEDIPADTVTLQLQFTPVFSDPK